MAEPTVAVEQAHHAALAVLVGAFPDDPDDWCGDIARRIVETLLSMRTQRGLAYLRGIRATNRLIELRRTVAATSPDPTVLIGYLPFERAVAAAADALVAGLGRRKES